MTFRQTASRIVFFLATLPVFAQAPSRISEYGRGFLKSVGDVRDAYVAATNGLPSRYERDLAQLAGKFQKAGDLDGLLAVKGEQRRFEAAFAGERDPFEAVPEMPSGSFVRGPAALRALQEGYVAAFAQAEKARKDAVADLARKFSEFLEGAQRTLTRNGRIEEAIAVRDHSDRIAGFLANGDFDGLVKAYPSFAGGAAQAGDAAPAGDRRRRPRDGKTGWRTWKHLATRAFSRDLPALFDRDLSSDVSADYAPATGRGRFTGVSRASSRQAGPASCEWSGSALLWKVDSPDDLAVSFVTASRKLTTNLDHGPHIQLAVFADGRREKLLNVPVYTAKDVIRIVRDRNNPRRFALYWPFGRQSETFELPADAGSIVVMLGVSLRDEGESCDISFQCQDDGAQ